MSRADLHTVTAERAQEGKFWGFLESARPGISHFWREFPVHLTRNGHVQGLQHGLGAELSVPGKAGAVLFSHLPGLESSHQGALYLDI